MTLEKCKTSGQAIMEYFILTIILVLAMLSFTNTTAFTSAKGAAEGLFNSAVNSITGQ